MKDLFKKKWVQIICIFLGVFLVLAFNPLHVYDNDRCQEQTYAQDPQSFSSDSESYVIGSLVESHVYGLTSGVGRLSRVVDPYAEDWFYNVQITYKSYRENSWQSYYELEEYHSQLGAQGLLFRIMDTILYKNIGGTAALEWMHMFNLILLSIVISIIGYYFFKRFNFLTMFFVLLGLLWNQWIPLSSINLYWVTWTMFLPMAISCIYSLSNKTKKNRRIFLLSMFISIVFKCACGYEFISTVLVAMMIPLCMEEVLNFTSVIKSFRSLIIPTVVGIAGFFTTLGMHLMRYILRGWGIKEAIWELQIVIVKRTYGSLAAMGLDYAALEGALKEPLSLVLSRYFVASSLNIPVGSGYIEIKIWMLLVIIAFALCISIYLIYKKKNNSKKLLTLVIGTVLSFLAPMSWFVLAKAHAAAHPFLDAMLWYIPFIPVSFGCIGYLLSGFRGKNRNETV